MPGPTVFISYAHADEPRRDELTKQLQPLKLAGELEDWPDRKVLEIVGAPMTGSVTGSDRIGRHRGRHPVS